MTSNEPLGGVWNVIRPRRSNVDIVNLRRIVVSVGGYGQILISGKTGTKHLTVANLGPAPSAAGQASKRSVNGIQGLNGVGARLMINRRGSPGRWTMVVGASGDKSKLMGIFMWQQRYIEDNHE